MKMKQEQATGMKSPAILTREFYDREPIAVARSLLGKKLVRVDAGLCLAVMITETEAYLGERDSASHAFKGKTPRTALLFGSPGYAYVYLIYGLHYLLNVVTGAAGEAGAVLIRAAVALEGEEHIRNVTGKSGPTALAGPAKLCRALAIDKSLNGWDLTRGEKLWCADGPAVEDQQIESGPRIGID